MIGRIYKKVLGRITKKRIIIALFFIVFCYALLVIFYSGHSNNEVFREGIAVVFESFIENEYTLSKDDVVSLEHILGTQSRMTDDKANSIVLLAWHKIKHKELDEARKLLKSLINSNLNGWQPYFAQILFASTFQGIRTDLLIIEAKKCLHDIDFEVLDSEADLFLIKITKELHSEFGNIVNFKDIAMYLLCKGYISAYQRDEAEKVYAKIENEEIRKILDSQITMLRNMSPEKLKKMQEFERANLESYKLEQLQTENKP